MSRVLDVGFDPADVFTATKAPLLQTLYKQLTCVGRSDGTRESRGHILETS